MAKDRGDLDTSDLFTAPERLFPVRAPAELRSALDFNANLARAMSRALDEARERGADRYTVAATMSELLGVEVTKAMVDAYTSAARETHTVSLVRFKAFVRATGCAWLWEVALAGDGLTLLQGEEALLAQAAYADKQAETWAARAKALKKAAPCSVVRPARRRR